MESSNYYCIAYLQLLLLSKIECRIWPQKSRQIRRVQDKMLLHVAPASEVEKINYFSGISRKKFTIKHHMQQLHKLHIYG